MFPLNDIAAYTKAFDANASENTGAPSVVTAGGTGDNSKVTGQSINRKNGSAIAHSCVIATGFVARLQINQTFSLAHEIAYGTDGTNFDTAVVIEAATVYATASGGTQNKRGIAQFGVDLMQQKQYLRVNVTPDINTANTDTAEFFTIVVLGGWTQLPQ